MYGDKVQINFSFIIVSKSSTDSANGKLIWESGM